jgi:hypothetical protein
MQQRTRARSRGLPAAAGQHGHVQPEHREHQSLFVSAAAR